MRSALESVLIDVGGQFEHSMHNEYCFWEPSC